MNWSTSTTAIICYIFFVALIFYASADCKSNFDKDPAQKSVTPPPSPLAERGYCLAGDYDILLSRLPLFNMSIRDESECISYFDTDNVKKSFSPPSNFLVYRYTSQPITAKRSFQFRVMSVYPTLLDAYLDFRRRSSIVADYNTQYEDLFVTLTNVGAGKQSNMHMYKRFQRSVIDKRVSFYHLRAQVVHGEFELKKSFLTQGQLHFSNSFLNHVQQHLLANVEKNQTAANNYFDERFFHLFGTHFARRGTFGGYVDLMITPWDIVCEVPTCANLSSFAKNISLELNHKFGLGPPRQNRGGGKVAKEEIVCSGLNISSWMLTDQDVLAIVSGSDSDFQAAISIAVRYPVFRDVTDKPLIRGWLHSLYQTPGLVEASLEPICELFPDRFALLKTYCKRNLLDYLKANEPFMRETNEPCPPKDGKRMIFDINYVGLNGGYNPNSILRDGCVSTEESLGLCPLEEEDNDKPNSATNESAASYSILLLLVGLYWSGRYFA